jgi:hypothetical protein
VDRRILQEDENGVLGHDAEGTEATLWNFEARTVVLPGRVEEVTTGEDLPARETYDLQAYHTCAISGTDELPEQV